MILAVEDLQAALVAERTLHASWRNRPESRTAEIRPIDPMVRAFARGLDGRHPPISDVVDLAYRLVHMAKERSHQPEITVDVDGALSFDLRLASGLLMFAELGVYGVLDLTVLDDSARETLVVRHLSPASESQFVKQL